MADSSATYKTPECRQAYRKYKMVCGIPERYNNKPNSEYKLDELLMKYDGLRYILDKSFECVDLRKKFTS